MKMKLLIFFLVIVAINVDAAKSKNQCNEPEGKVGSKYRDVECNVFLCRKQKDDPNWVKLPKKPGKLGQALNDCQNCVMDSCIKNDSAIIFPSANETAEIPEDFKPLLSKTYIVKGVEHAQHAYYNEETMEAIVHVPAHADFDPVVSVITSKDGNGKAKVFSCQNSMCDFNDLPDELNMNVENILHDLEISKRAGNNLQYRQQVQERNVKKIFTVRSNFRELTEEEYDNLTPSMIALAEGKEIFTSDVTVEYEETAMDMFYPIKEVESENHRNKRQAPGCKLMYGCQDSWTGCGWGYTPLDLEVVTLTTPNVHNYNTIRFCVQCLKDCRNPNFNGLQMKCDDIIDEQSLSLSYYAAWRDTCITRSRYRKYCQNEPNPYGNPWFGMCMDYHHNC